MVADNNPLDLEAWDFYRNAKYVWLLQRHGKCLIIFLHWSGWKNFSRALCIKRQSVLKLWWWNDFCSCWEVRITFESKHCLLRRKVPEKRHLYFGIFSVRKKKVDHHQCTRNESVSRSNLRMDEKVDERNPNAKKASSNRVRSLIMSKEQLK